MRPRRRCSTWYAGHEGSTVVVGVNGLHLLRDAAWQRAARPGDTW
nr:hypothetical protein OG781_36165 [Streptomyces sp. NBC_00830]